MKKMLSLLLTLVIAATMLTGCGSRNCHTGDAFAERLPPTMRVRRKSSTYAQEKRTSSDRVAAGSPTAANKINGGDPNGQQQFRTHEVELQISYRLYTEVSQTNYCILGSVTQKEVIPFALFTVMLPL